MTPPSHSLDVLTGLASSVPDALAERAERWGPGDVPVAPRASASVVLLRDAPAGLQTYLLHRHVRMSFAASMVVFPGGGLDAPDAVADDPVLACGLRETHEETGVVLQASGLRRWAHWVTPEIEPRRYDTVFYVAALPESQEAADVSGETDRADWTRPADALAAATRGEIALMPPTRSILTELAALESVEAVLAQAQERVVATVLPLLERRDDEWVFRYPTPGRISPGPISSGPDSTVPISPGTGEV